MFRQTAPGVIFITVRAIIDTILLRYEVGDRVKALRKANNMSVKDLAKQMSMRTGSLRMIEFGGREMTAYNYLRLHEIFGVSLHYIITGKELETNPPD
ncbi:MAG: helix-turn-helix domain-containing protein [Defluviitaleaceae bacterium]|nr:helix-turn-helix domain-containing protein [Defluviitaleaceae bacterium]